MVEGPPPAGLTPTPAPHEDDVAISQRRGAPSAACALVDFWFGPEAGPRRWFARDSAFDAALATRFGELGERAARGELQGWESTPIGGLALLLLYDQLPRNLHRGTAAAFATDAAARALAQRIVARGQDQKMTPRQRLFVALPFEHAEDLSAQDQAVAYLEALEEQAPAGDRDLLSQATHYARSHRDAIARFGRFPGRNEALGRATTAAEAEAMARGEALF